MKAFICLLLASTSCLTFAQQQWGQAPAQAQTFVPAPSPVNGVPVDTAEVAQAKAAHLAAHSRAIVQNGGNSGPQQQQQQQQYQQPQYQQQQYQQPQQQYQQQPQSNYNAAPYYNNAPAYQPQSQSQSQYPQHIPVIKNGVPVETPEVQLAKADHFAAIAKVQGSPDYIPERQSQSQPQSQYYSQAPVQFPQSYGASSNNGAPVETPEVQQAKAQHFAAVAQAQSFSRNRVDNNNGQWNRNDN